MAKALLVRLWSAAIAALFLVSPARANVMGPLDPNQLKDLESKLRVGVLQISESNKAVIIGIDATHPLNQAWSVNAEAVGFVSADKSIRAIDPRFLVFIHDQGIHSIHSFSMGGVSREEVTEKFDLKKQLPEVILKAESIRRQLLMAKPPGIFKKVLNSVRGHAINLFNRIFRNHKEDARRSSGLYLSQIIDSHLLKGNFPDLDSVFTRFELDEMGALLSIRFHPGGFLGGAFVSPETRRQLYHRLIRLRSDKAAKGMDYLISRANEEGLVLHPLSNNFALLYYDLKRSANDDHFNRFRLDLEDSEILKSIEKYKAVGDGLLPLGVFAVGPKFANKNIINLDNPGHDTSNNIVKYAAGIANDVQGTFFPFSFPLRLMINIGKDLARFKLVQNGSTIFSDDIVDFASLTMLFETGVVDFEYSPDQFPYYEKNIRTVFETHFEQETFVNALKSGQPDTINNAIRELYVRNLEIQEGGKLSGGDTDETAKRQRYRLRAWNRFLNWISEPKFLEELDAKLNLNADKEEKKSAERAKPIIPDPGFPLFNTNDSDQESNSLSSIRPVVLMMVDGLRPDEFRRAADRGLMPYAKHFFIDQGIEFKSFTPISNTIPSWSTVISGVDPDTHGNRFTTNASRNAKVKIHNFIDFRTYTKGKVLKFKGKPSLQYDRLKDHLADKPTPSHWLFDYIPDQFEIKTFFPIVDGKFLPFDGMLSALQRLGASAEIAYGTVGAGHTFDIGMSTEVANAIRKNPSGHSFVTAFFGSIDTDMHVNQSVMDDAYRAVDEAMGNVFRAVKNDPILKNAIIFLVSDHGSIGGNEVADPKRPFLPDAYQMDNTTFNLIKFFAGDYPGASKNFDFVVGSHKPADPQLYLSPVNSMLRGESYTYRGVAKRQGRDGYKDNRTVIIEPYGDRQANILFLENSHKSPTEKLSYFQLRNYMTSETKVNLDIIGSLLDYQLTNTDAKGKAYADGTDMQTKITEINGRRPVGHIAMALSGPTVSRSICIVTTVCDFDRDPVLVMASEGKFGLVLSRGEGDAAQFLYLVLSRFQQFPTGSVDLEISQSPEQDPLGYMTSEKPFPAIWMSEREILMLTKDLWYPTAIFSVVKNLTLSPSVQKGPYSAKLQAETPDLVLFAGFGFHFNSHQMHQADHGGITRYETQQTFFVNDSDSAIDHVRLDYPVLARDLAPTVLDYLGIETPPNTFEGTSLRTIINEIRNTQM